jgi:hypothetical protein
VHTLVLNRSFCPPGEGLFVVGELFVHPFNADDRYRVREGERIVQGGAERELDHLALRSVRMGVWLTLEAKTEGSIMPRVQGPGCHGERR